MYGCESWTIKKVEYQRIDAFNLWCWRRLLTSLDSKEINQSILKETNLWIIIGRPDAEAEAPVPWPPDAKNWIIRKHPGTGEDWRREEKGMTEDQTVGWHHWLNGNEFEQTMGVREGQGSLACCIPWRHRVRYDWASEQPTTFVSKVMSLLFNMLSRFVIAFLPANKHLLISRLQSLSTVILEAKK